jgi:prepilin-type N-terminal cleavage/methylation domain-containing protein
VICSSAPASDGARGVTGNAFLTIAALLWSEEHSMLDDGHDGFTLIELSIVLVIVGLIAGGVLVGRDLIAAAAIRAQITQIQQLQTAVSTFRTKYNAIPGDLPASDADQLGMVTRDGTAGHGDGNGFLDSCGGSSGNLFGCETALIWADLSSAGLIGGTYAATPTDAVIPVAAGAQDSYFPAAKVGTGNSVAAFSAQPPSTNEWCKKNVCFALVHINSIDATGQFSLSRALTPNQAYAIDTKLDDGLPHAGVVVSGDSDGRFLYPAIILIPPLCLTLGVTPTGYNLAAADTTSCVMNVPAM